MMYKALIGALALSQAEAFAPTASRVQQSRVVAASASAPVAEVPVASRTALVTMSEGEHHTEYEMVSACTALRAQRPSASAPCTPPPHTHIPEERRARAPPHCAHTTQTHHRARVLVQFDPILILVQVLPFSALMLKMAGVF